MVFEGLVRSDDFGRAALAMARTVRGEFDDATYRQRWGHYFSLEGFPLGQCRRLRRLSRSKNIVSSECLKWVRMRTLCPWHVTDRSFLPLLPV